MAASMSQDKHKIAQIELQDAVVSGTLILPFCESILILERLTLLLAGQPLSFWRVKAAVVCCSLNPEEDLKYDILVWPVVLIILTLLNVEV